MAFVFSDGTSNTGAGSTTDQNVFDFATEAESPRRTREDLHGLLLSFPTGPKKGSILSATKEVIRAISGGFIQECEINLKKLNF
jgi:hypothetical protein